MEFEDDEPGRGPRRAPAGQGCIRKAELDYGRRITSRHKQGRGASRDMLVVGAQARVAPGSLSAPLKGAEFLKSVPGRNPATCLGQPQPFRKVRLARPAQETAASLGTLQPTERTQ